MRQYTLSDQMCLKADYVWRFLTGNHFPAADVRENPAKDLAESGLSEKEKKHVAGMMRVNYTGEVCAQALYQGQALTSRSLDIKNQLEQAGLEEIDHLYWCQIRLKELDSRVSFLNPLWYTASFLLGAAAGLCGDRWSLGFLEETEKQVAAHLEKHLEKLPLQDKKTRAILEKMRDEESAHAQTAYHAGAVDLPSPVKTAMKKISTFMTRIAYVI
jgi:ubiquinone biosynthesis monooxygenase Coq7